MSERRCVGCGNPIDPSRSEQAIFCGDPCRKRTYNSTYYRKKAKARKPLRRHKRGEAEVVMGDELSVVLQKWRKSHDTMYNIGPNTDYYGEGVTSAVAWLAFEAQINERRVSGLINGEFRYVSAWQVDAILTALNLSHLLIDGTLKIVPNPDWSLMDWLDYMQKRGC